MDKSARVAFRQLFLARGCGLQELSEFRHTLQILGFDISVYFGEKPDLPIQLISKGSIPFDPTQDRSEPLSFGFQSVEDSKYKGMFFVELFCEKRFNISEAEFDALNIQASEAEAKVKIISSFRASEEKNVFAVVNVLSGFIGLRIHPQFTFETLNESYWIWIDRDGYWGPDSIVSQSIRLLEGPKINEVGLSLIKNFVLNSAINIKDLETISLCFSLLRRGWQEEDATYKFIHLFTALELIIKFQTDGKDHNERELVGKIEDIISKHAKAEDVQNLLNFIKGMGIRARSLPSRFEEVAEAANFESRLDDVEAFKQFSRARNTLYHAGKGIPLSVNTKSGKTIKLEGLVEQYLNWSLFRDDRPYESRFHKRSRLIQQ